MTSKLKLALEDKSGVDKTGVVYAINPTTKKPEFGVVVQGGKRLGVYFASDDSQFVLQKIHFSAIKKIFKVYLHYTTEPNGVVVINDLALQWFKEFFIGATPQTLNAPNYRDWMLETIKVGQVVGYSYIGDDGDRLMVEGQVAHSRNGKIIVEHLFSTTGEKIAPMTLDVLQVTRILNEKDAKIFKDLVAKDDGYITKGKLPEAGMKVIAILKSGKMVVAQFIRIYKGQIMVLHKGKAKIAKRMEVI